MITPVDLIHFDLLENPFTRFGDTRFFYPGLSGQRQALEATHHFISSQKDPAKNLGVVSGSSGSGKSMLAMKLAETRFPTSGRGTHFGLYMNTNTVTEPRHFLMSVIETLGLPSSRSNANRIESIFERLAEGDDQLLLVLDGPPVDQEYLTQLLEWSVEHQRKIKAVVFLQDLNNLTSNIGGLNRFLGQYLTYSAPSVPEIASMLFWRCLAAGHPDPTALFPEEEFGRIAQKANGSLSEALNLANQQFEALLGAQNDRGILTNFRKWKI
ncbi:MAG: hypothetical protein VB029_07895 [Anaerolineaceae bacterium]|jgi:ABC-type dipeptide/oligopeptide/nickel transport system ATPase component|nr:hypothetical protein [Anaerolineaceae bacterium]HNX46570.1 hypothetical protein [Anaerolineaceae bacterium]HPT23142.1 hypothetical protein [Anaerolineaceae bacterium]